ncbi:MAG: choice-of-anchor Q domain-containing protein, partial [Patescibacteria group bacterium]
DFHLQSSSPAIDKGVYLALVIKDFDGTIRPQGFGYDIGAYEYTSGTTSDTTPPAAPTGIRVK